MEPNGTLTECHNKPGTSELDPHNESEKNACNSSSTSGAEVNSTSFPDSPQEKQKEMTEFSQRYNGKENSALSKESHTKHSKADIINLSSVQNECLETESSKDGKVQHACDSTNSELNRNEASHSTSNGKLNEVVVRTSKPLCADYQSESDSESAYSKSDSSSSTDMSTSASSESESESDDSSAVTNQSGKGEKKLKGDILLTDLPPIENLKITVPEDACVEIGTVTSIVETLVIVESYKGTSALDIDTVLFLDNGKRTLGRVFEILGPVSEPVYAVRFNSQEEIKNLNITKSTKVYYAPKTEHTTFVFMSEVLKNKGSDASWKDNVEAPLEFQDFSDDEEERKHKNKKCGEVDREHQVEKEQNKSRKRPFNKRQTSGGIQRGRFRCPGLLLQRPHFQRIPPVNPFVSPPPFPPRSNFPSQVHIPPFPYNVPPYASAPPHHPFSPGFSGPPFPTFGAVPLLQRGQNFQQPFHQQRAHCFPQAFGAWGRPPFRPMPPPPPPPPGDQTDRQSLPQARP